MTLYDYEKYAKTHTFNEMFHLLKEIENKNSKYVHVSAFVYNGIKCIVYTCSGNGVAEFFFKGDTFITLRSISKYFNYFVGGDYLTHNAKKYIDNENFKRLVFNIEHGYQKNDKLHYKKFKKENITLNESKLRQIIKESIEKYLHGGSDVSTIVSNQFSLSPAYRRAMFEAAFIILGYERFAIDGEISGKGLMDDPWDDAYSILCWAVENNGLDERYVGKISQGWSDMNDQEFREYANQVQCGKAFWFTKEELADVLNYCMQMCSVLHLDPIQIMNDKMDKTEKKYPVEKAKGVSTKYNKL